MSDGGVELSAYVGEHFCRVLVISRGNLCARFLQVRARGAQRRLTRLQQSRRRLGGLCGSQRGLQGVDARGRLGVRGVDGRTRARLAVGRLAAGVHRSLAGIERVVERLPVVALLDGGAGLVQGGDGGGEVGGGVAIGPGGSRGIDRRLCLIDLLLWRLGTARGEQHDENHQQATHRESIPTMKTVAPHDRPREKLERLGVAGLGDNELLALVLGHGDTRTSALELANAALSAVGGLDGLARATPDDLRRVAGIGAARAAQLVAAVEIGRRSLTRRREARPQILSAVDAARLLVPQFGALPVEQFGVLLLDTKHRVVRITRLSVGTLDASIVHPREVFRAATAAGAAALVLFHNHPSGDPTPSEDDVALTKRLVRAGDLMGMAVLDHVIVAENGFASLRERGDLNG